MANRPIPVPFTPPPAWRRWIQPIPYDGLVINPYGGAIGMGAAGLGIGALGSGSSEAIGAGAAALAF